MTQQMWYAILSFPFCWEQLWDISVYRITQDEFCRLFKVLSIYYLFYFDYFKKDISKEELEHSLHPLFENILSIGKYNRDEDW